jgi:hypothetical protein
MERIGDGVVAHEGVALCAATRSTAINPSQIKEHTEVKGSDGKHVGTVLGLESGRVKIAFGGMDHYIDIATLDVLEDDWITLSTTADETVRTWH